MSIIKTDEISKAKDRIVRALQLSDDGRLMRTAITKKFRMPASIFNDALAGLIASEVVETFDIQTSGRPSTAVRLKDFTAQMKEQPYQQPTALSNYHPIVVHEPQPPESEPLANCLVCRYYVPIESELHNEGYCKRGCPVANPTTGKAVFPIVNRNDSCGEAKLFSTTQN